MLKSTTNGTVVENGAAPTGSGFYPQGTVFVRLGLTYHFYIPAVTQGLNPLYITTLRDSFSHQLDAFLGVTTFSATVNNVLYAIVAFVPTLQLNTTHLFYSNSRRSGMGGEIEIIG